ncbi:hypothetical protein SARC_13077 [Sphaeroforma arctica JP610]|uniref:Uncharacterized protein n=1 Tax=Sphaeroforma arctica JP610 TaxID=667725 RepID=A0A0L0FC82_9EUKA|nr:hypothetical protein SARC_13077 [Sphaeroforma arctica JP610]KNC74375.1 hypothetical protein SARC_13077 [Sphaeroforma arctica JP610]|eukprot:XP_014148277.1 hypothetical protein SARC_13077 [Sphaeroforma arctica JP610]
MDAKPADAESHAQSRPMDVTARRSLEIHILTQNTTYNVAVNLPLSPNRPTTEFLDPQTQRTDDGDITGCGEFDVETSSAVVYDNDDLECKISIRLKEDFLLNGMKVSLISRIVYRRIHSSSLLQETSSTTQPIDITILLPGELKVFTVNFLVPMFSPPSFRTRHDVYLGEELIHLDAEVQWLIVLVGKYPGEKTTINGVVEESTTSATTESVLALKQITKRTLYQPESQYIKVEGISIPHVMSAIAPSFRKATLGNGEGGCDGIQSHDSKDSFGSSYGVGPATGVSRTGLLTSQASVGGRDEHEEEEMEVNRDTVDGSLYYTNSRSGEYTRDATHGNQGSMPSASHNSSSPSARSPSTHKPEMTFMYDSNQPTNYSADCAYADMETTCTGPPMTGVGGKIPATKYQMVMRAKIPGMINTDEVFTVNVKVRDVSKLLYVRRVRVQLNQNVTYMYGDQRRQWSTVVASAKAKPKTGPQKRTVLSCDVRLDTAQKKYRRDFRDFAAESYLESYPVPTCIVTNKHNKILLSVEYTVTIKCYVRGGKDIRRMVPIVMESRTSLPETVGISV